MEKLDIETSLRGSYNIREWLGLNPNEFDIRAVVELVHFACKLSRFGGRRIRGSSKRHIGTSQQGRHKARQHNPPATVFTRSAGNGPGSLKMSQY